MTVSYPRLLQFYQQFGKFYTRKFAPLLERTGFFMPQIPVLLFLFNNPDYDTAREGRQIQGRRGARPPDGFSAAESAQFKAMPEKAIDSSTAPAREELL